MKGKEKLTASDREFFGKVARAAFSNPFGRERFELDLSIAGAEPSISRDELVDRVIRMVGERLKTLSESKRAELSLYSGEDREVLRIVFLFDIYHRHRKGFDEFILSQIESGDTPCRVPFARETFALLHSYGFDPEESRRNFAIFYQIRRAFHFIENSLTGLSPSMHTLRHQLWNNVFTSDIGWYDKILWNRMEDFSTLLLGETGTGKGAAAAAIGRSGFIPFDVKTGCFSESFTRNFIAINLSQYPESLLESELFGHKKGAFTGAMENHNGIFSRCTPHGSIFLDEIGDVAVPVQIKLLQILQDRTFSPVGSHERLRFNGRVIAATNRPLHDLRRAGIFRDDFYYRLCSDIITVPTLRRRIREEPRELDLLVAAIIRRMIGPGGEDVAEQICAALRKEPGVNYPWPGNVRELEQAVRRIILTRNYRGELSCDTKGAVDQFSKDLDRGEMDAQTLMARYCHLLHRRHGTFEAVARRTGLDRRTVKKYILSLEAGEN
jgi:transcriptional regulator with AAA-type ATPase domain